MAVFFINPYQVSFPKEFRVITFFGFFDEIGQGEVPSPLVDPHDFNPLINQAKNHNLDALKASLKEILSQDISVLNRTQLNAALYKMLNTENLAVYLIFSLIIIIALFNVVGALIMMFLDKKPQLKILYTMGLRPKEIQRVFFYLGGLICWVGGGLGVLTGVLLVLIQDYFPLLYVPGTSLPYPVLFELKNFLIVLFTILILGSLTTAWATRNMDKKVSVL